jgi:alpha-ketoglutarate-dependent taurine dioxygenase
LRDVKVSLFTLLFLRPPKGSDSTMDAQQRQLGTRLDVTPSEAMADAAVLRRVAAALTLHGVVALKAELNLSPSALAAFTIALATERNEDHVPGCLVKGVEDLSDAACPNVRIGDDGPLAGENVGLVLSNVLLQDADAFGVAPLYRGRGRMPGGGTDKTTCDGPQAATAGVDANLAAVWHQDEQFRRLPASFTALYCVRTPSKACDDTVYADTQSAFATLPASLRRRLLDETGLAYRLADHSLATVETEVNPTERVDQEVQTHPLVLNTPGGPSLYLGSRNARVAGLASDDARTLMDELIAHCVERPNAAHYAHHHQPGVLLIGCNRSALHRATPGIPPVALQVDEARHLIRFQAEEPFPLLRLRL